MLIYLSQSYSHARTVSIMLPPKCCKTSIGRDQVSYGTSFIEVIFYLFDGMPQSNGVLPHECLRRATVQCIFRRTLPVSSSVLIIVEFGTLCPYLARKAVSVYCWVLRTARSWWKVKQKLDTSRLPRSTKFLQPSKRTKMTLQCCESWQYYQPSPHR